MDSSLDGNILDSSKCNNLSMDEKRELVHEISKWSDGAPDILQSWSRRELLQILSVEMGKERKYTGLTKSRIIEHLLKVVSENKISKRKNVADPESQPSNSNNTSKRPRKADKPSRLPNAVTGGSNGDVAHVKYCQNLACRATLQQNDAFCKRCSCCICSMYDDNKDPSLWLVCSSEPPFEGDSCGMSCHLECAIKHERSGLVKDGNHKGLDGIFECVCCGKPNDLLRCWKKQLMIAKDTRRVDVLCYRVSLSQKLLRGTKKYQKLNDIVETAAKKLEAEVGSIAGPSGKLTRGIVNRLSSGPDIQKLCASAVETLDLMCSSKIPHYRPNPKTSDSNLLSSELVRFENVKATSLTVVLGPNGVSAEDIVGYTLWHRKADSPNYPPDPTCTLFVPNTRFLLSDLSAGTQYLVKVVPFSSGRQVSPWEVTITTDSAVPDVANALVAERDQSPTTNSSSVSNPSSEGDESNNNTAHREGVDDLSGKGMQETPGVSVSLLDEERATCEDGAVHNSTIPKEPMNSSNPTIVQQVGDITKRKSSSPGGLLFKELGIGNVSNSSGKRETEIVVYERGSNANPSNALAKTGINKDRPGSSVRPEPSDEELCNGCGNPEKETEIGSSAKKKKGNARTDEHCTRDESSEKEYAHCVKMIRQLERDGHMEQDFRLKFLTWYSLRATPEEQRIVKVYADTFADDPGSLAGQLIDTFSDDVNNKRPQGVLGNGFCMRIFH